MKKKSIVYLSLILFLIIIVSACENTNPYAATSDRPGIPIPVSYSAEVPTVSDIFIVEEANAGATDFNPLVSKIWNSEGDLIYNNTTGKNIALMDNGVLKTPIDSASDGPGLASKPVLQFERYWKLIDGPTGYPGYSSESFTVISEESVTSTETFSFTETLSVETTVSVDTLFASGSVTASASFSATQEFSNTSWSSDTYSHTFTISALEGKDCVYAVWQLHERLRYVGEDGETFTDPKYEFAQNSVIWDYPTNEIVPVATYF